MNKRQFVKLITLAGAGFTMSSLEKLFASVENISIQEIVKDEDFWQQIRKDYILKSDYINLENGYYSMMPQPIMNEYIRQIQEMNLQASFYMRNQLNNDKLNVRKQMAEFLNCSVDEIIITRNTTESLDTIISGIDWKPGDEALTADQDYGSMLDMFKQQVGRFGLIYKNIEMINHPKTDDEIVSLYEKHITPKTRLLMVCHMINITGQILPIRKICDMAHKKGVEVMVDGAHSLAHIDFKIDDLNCDYFGSSLHKWLSVPLGAGLLYVKKKKIEKLWPLFGDSSIATDDIRKLNHTGTHPMQTELTIKTAIKYHQTIGAKRKEERLRYLQNYWTSKVQGVENIILNTPLDANRSCGIANVGIERMKPSVLGGLLFDRYHIWTVAIDHPHVKGVRITPSIYTTTGELDQLVLALKEIAKK